MVYLDGAYRRHFPEDARRFTKLAVDAFPDFAGRIECFGADWLGRQFAIDFHRVVDGAPQVLMLEPGTGEALEIPVDEATFHAQELVDEPDAAVAHFFFKGWLSAGGRRPEYDQCVGYRKPLYLGGADDVTNLELSDFEVYWVLAAQILRQVRGLPIGTPIGKGTISGSN
jgi:hypothetical protein